MPPAFASTRVSFYCAKLPFRPRLIQDLICSAVVVARPGLEAHGRDESRRVCRVSHGQQPHVSADVCFSRLIHFVQPVPAVAIFIV